MNPFKGRHFQRDIILWAVRWYCKYGISYRELQEMLAERGVNVDHSTIYRWVQRYAPEMENGCAGTGVTLPIFARGTWMKPTKVKWPLGVSVPGRRQPGPHCRFYLSSRRNSKACIPVSGQNPQQREEVADPTIHQHG